MILVYNIYIICLMIFSKFKLYKRIYYPQSKVTKSSLFQYVSNIYLLLLRKIDIHQYNIIYNQINKYLIP